MTQQEEMDYRCSCPYDAMGDYSVLVEKDEEKEKEEKHPPDRR